MCNYVPQYPFLSAVLFNLVLISVTFFELMVVSVCLLIVNNGFV